CRVCGRLLLHGDGHDRSLFHRSRANGGDGDIIGQWRVDGPAEHPDAIRCFGAWLARDPVGRAAGDGCFGPGDCATGTANTAHRRAGRARRTPGPDRRGYRHRPA
ncbi:unnamed protein product, partial [Ixodes pacificus]